MTKPITDSTAYVGCYADADKTPWPRLVLWPLCVLAFAWGILGSPFQRIR